ncbi:hypothetical protein ACO0DA_20220 [Bacillus subtilis]|uniref:hypothetical protein n=1 Tax=Bacillus TaxID=1386 RepID=UPI00217EBF26|nr:hypothetical protein [Bacillus subtilis]UWJ02585.1 hypothetical protein N0B18_06790 [Bacillus subtilis]WFO97887.1 hypothetical protein JEQ25_12735 [Bacillus subtilis]
MNFRITSHAHKRLQSRFGIKNHRAAYVWVADHLKDAEYLGIHVDENGREARMYGGKGIVIHIGVNDNNVITVYKARKHLGANLIKEAFATLKENVQAALKSNENLREELNEEIEYFRAEYKRTRSAAKRMAYQARINALQMRLDELPTESLDLKRDLYKAAEGVAAYV